MYLTRFAMAATCLTGTIALAACNDSTVGVTSGPAHVRIINSVFQMTDDDGTLSLAAPRQIDFLFDNATTGAGAAAIPAIGVAPAPTTVAQSNYHDLSQGLHTFWARLAGGATPTTSLFTASSDPTLEFTPTLYFTGDTYYTFIVAGIAPRQGLPDAGSFIDPDQYDTPFPIIDDASHPPKRDGKYLARFRLVNAAPFALDGSTPGVTQSIILTSGTTPPTLTQVLALRVSGSAVYRTQSVYSNAAEGPYVVTIVAGSPRQIIAQMPITLASGEVVTFLVQNTGPVDPASPASAFKLTTLVDQQF